MKFQRFVIPAAAILLSIPASWQFFNTDYFDGHDSLLHLLRMVEFDASLRSGDLFPRWSPDLALGYGYPLFNYYPPLTYYLAQAFHLLSFGFDDALKAVIVAGFALSGLGMYLFANDLYRSRPAALLSSAAFIYFPYHLTDAYIRGAIPEITLIALLPWALWAFQRLALYATLKYLIVAALLLASLILSHVVFIFFLPILAAFSLHTALIRSPRRKPALLLSAGAFALGFVLTAFYWLPVLLEKQYVSLVAADWVVGETIKDELLAPDALVQSSPTYDYEAKFPPKLAATDLGLAVAGLGVWLFRNNRRRLGRFSLWLKRSPTPVSLPSPPAITPELTVFIAALPVLIFMLSDASFPFWRQAPLIGLVQFPWRLLAFIGLSTSLLAGNLAPRGKLAYPVAILACIAIVFINTRGLNLDSVEGQDSSPSLETLARYEYDTGVMGTAYANEWLPAATGPRFTSPKYEPFPSPEPDDTAEAVITGFRRNGPLSYSASVVARQTTRLRFHSFFFPGWQATVDGRPVRTYPSTGLGLTTFDLPAGQHQVALSFVDTATRTIGRTASLAGLAALSLSCLRAACRRIPTVALRDAVPSHPLSRYVVGGVPLLFAGLLFLSPHLLNETGPVAETVDFGGRLRLLNYEVDVPAAGARTIPVTLYWQTIRTMEDDLHLTLEAFDAHGSLIGRQDGAPIYSTAQTSTWNKNEIVRDKWEIRLSLEPFSPLASIRLSIWAGEELLGSTELGAVR